VHEIPGFERYAPDKIKKALMNLTCSGVEGHRTEWNAFVTSHPMPEKDQWGSWTWDTALGFLCSKCGCVVYVKETAVLSDDWLSD